MLDRRTFMGALSGAALTGCSAKAPAPEAETKPNFLFILVDDLGWADVAVNGSTFYETPNIDRLASQGMRFTNGYAACPVCSPTRASIQTGKHPARLQITNFISGPHALPYSAVIPPRFYQQLPPEHTTIAEALEPAGYTSGAIGKWHLGGEGSLPTDHGYAYNYAGTHSGMPRSFFYPEWEGNPPVTAEDGSYLPDHLTDKALAFMEERRDQPFFLYMSYYTVHIPIEAKEADIERFRAKVDPNATPGEDQHNPVYAAMIWAMDQNVGRLLDKLDELGIADNTVVFFMSDNGGLQSPEWKGEPVTSNRPLRAGKGRLYEGGIREPWIVRRPSRIEPGSVCEEPVISTDFLPTILEMAGVDGPMPPDGESIVPLLEQTREEAPDRRPLFWHYPHYSNQLGRPGGAVRQGAWKLIEFYDDDSLELYNLNDDIGEERDLAAEESARAQEMREMLHAWREEVNAQMPTPNPDYDPARKEERRRPALDRIKPL